MIVVVVAGLYQLGDFRLYPYWNQAVSVSAAGFRIGLPLAAAVAAWEGTRLRRLHLDRRLAMQPPLAIVWPQLLPIVLAVAVGYGTVLSGSLGEVASLSGGFNGWILLSYFATTLSAVLSGYILGFYFVAPVAIPVALILNYQWASFPLQDGSNLSWRHMSGYTLIDCCTTVYEQPAPVALLAPLFMAAALLFSVAVLFWTVRVWIRAVSTLAAITVAALIAYILVSPLSAYPSEMRDPSALVCKGNEPVVCIWPEQEEVEGASDRNALDSAFQSLVMAGHDIPSRIETRDDQSGATTAPPGMTWLYYTPGSGKTQLLANYAFSLLRDFSCHETDDPKMYISELQTTQAWMLLTWGIRIDEIGSVVPQETIDKATVKMKQGTDEYERWLDERGISSACK